MPSTALPSDRAGHAAGRLRGAAYAVWLPVLVALGCTAVYVLYSLLQWQRWDVPSWDNAIFTQLLRSYTIGEPLVVDIKGQGFNALGDHFHPLLVILVPVYWLFPSALTLVLVQDVLFGISVAGVTRCAVRALRPAPAAAVGVAYGLSFGLQNAVAVQFHEIALAVPLLALGLGALRERRWVAAAAWCAPVALVKEDLGLTVAAVGALMLAQALRLTAGARRPAVLGAGLVLWGAGLSVLAVTVVLPGLNPGGAFAYADELDLAGLLREPAAAVRSLFVPGQKLATWLLTGAAGAVIAVRSPIALVALPTLAWRMLSSHEGYWGTGWHYNAVVMPVVFVALVDSVVRLRRRSHRSRARGSTAAAGPWLALAVALLVGAQQPLAQAASPASWQPDPRARAKARVAAAVPDGASVATDLSLINALAARTDVHWIGNSSDPAPEYAVVDRLGATWGGVPPLDVARYARELYGRDYAVERDEANIILVRREDPRPVPVR